MLKGEVEYLIGLLKGAEVITTEQESSMRIKLAADAMEQGRENHRTVGLKEW